MQTPVRAVRSLALALVLTLIFLVGAVSAQSETMDETEMMDMEQCAWLPSHADLRAALQEVVAEGDNGGFGLHMWASLVNRDGVVCAVAFSGDHRGDQWPGSRVISAQKANTANAFSLPGLALSTANLYTAVQPGNSLFGLQFSNPVDTAVAYGGDATHFGHDNDPMVGYRLGGVNVFGGGLALYAWDGTLVGAIGTSGDASCTDHIIAWKVRDLLDLDYVPAGVSPTGDDNISYDAGSGWDHPDCGGGQWPISDALPEEYPIGSAETDVAAMMSTADMSVIDGSMASVRRTDQGIRIDVHTSDLSDGHAYTVWALIFNSPENCAEEMCGMGDMGSTDAGFAMINAGGAVIANGSRAHLGRTIPLGSEDWDMGPDQMGLTNPWGATVMLVIQDHGEPIEGMVELQTSVPNAGCGEGENPHHPDKGPGNCPEPQMTLIGAGGGM